MSYIRKSGQKTSVVIASCLLSTATLAIWVDFLYPEEIAKKAAGSVKSVSVGMRPLGMQGGYGPCPLSRFSYTGR